MFVAHSHKNEERKLLEVNAPDKKGEYYRIMLST